MSHGVAAAYTETIREYIEKGYLRKIANDTTARKWYLPHFAVVRSEKEALYDGISALRIHASAHFTQEQYHNVAAVKCTTLDSRRQQIPNICSRPISPHLKTTRYIVLT